MRVGFVRLVSDGHYDSRFFHFFYFFLFYDYFYSSRGTGLYRTCEKYVSKTRLTHKAELPVSDVRTKNRKKKPFRFKNSYYSHLSVGLQ